MPVSKRHHKRRKVLKNRGVVVGAGSQGKAPVDGWMPMDQVPEGVPFWALDGRQVFVPWSRLSTMPPVFRGRPKNLGGVERKPGVYGEADAQQGG